MTSPRNETLNRLTDIVFDKALNTLRTPAKSEIHELLSDMMTRLDSELDLPLRLSATVPNSSKLLIRTNRVNSGDGGNRALPPDRNSFSLYVDTSIDFHTASVSGGTVKRDGGTFTLPNITVGQFIRMGLSYDPVNNWVDTTFSSASASVSGLTDPVTLFSALLEPWIGYLDLESDGVSSFKSPGSVSGYIENSVGGTPYIHRFIAGGSGGGGLQPTAVSGSFTAAAGNHYQTNTASSAFNATLPTGTAGSVIMFSDANETWDTNPLTIIPATGQKIDGFATNETLICDVERGWVELSWNTMLSAWTMRSLSTFSVVTASATQAGIVSTGSQTFAGAKTFQDGITTAGLTFSGGTAANLSLWSASNVLRMRGGTSGLAFDNTSAAALGTVTDAGVWTIGLSQTAALGAPTIQIYGSISGIATALTDAAKRVILQTNTFISGSGFPARDSNSSTLSGAYLAIMARTSDTNAAFDFRTNLIADTNTTVSTSVMTINVAGLVDIGSGNATLKGTHLIVSDPVQTTPSTAPVMIVSVDRNSSSASAALLVRSTAGGAGTSTNGLFEVMNQSTNSIFSVNNNGIVTIGQGTATTHRINTTVATTVGAAGGASALPATPTGYITINVNGTNQKIPYYAV